jgi:heme-degrading monooxygenase HmoA
MFARTTLFEVDTLRMPLAEAEGLFVEQVLPLLKQQPGFAGVYVMRTPEGKGMVISLWDNEQAAQSGIESGYYQQQITKFITFMRQPLGREHYEVTVAEVPARANTG